MGLLSGKKILITGVASNRSIAAGIANAMYREGAELAFTYQGDKLKGRVEMFAADWGSDIVLPCDVTSDKEIDDLFSALSDKWDGLDGIVHSIAYAPADQLEGQYVDSVTRDGFRVAHEVSSYSLAALTKAGQPLMKDRNGSILTLTYLGAERAVPFYNVMGVAKASLEANVRYLAGSLGPRGIRVNGISAGPVRTLAASGIKGFRKMLTHHEEVAPMRECTTIEQVGNSAVFLCSDWASGITGEILYVDNGYHITAMGDLG